MDIQISFAVGMIVLFFVIPTLYVWTVKHPSRSLWKWAACFVVIIHGPAIFSGYLIGYLMDFTIYGLGYIFQMNYEIATDVARMVHTVLAVSTIIPGVYTVTKIIRRSPKEKQIARVGALYSAPEAIHPTQG